MAEVRSYTVQTLGDLKEHGMGLYAHCSAPDAGHGSKLDLDALIERFGYDWGYVGRLDEIGRRCVCKVCGHHGAHIKVVSKTPSAPINPYERNSNGY